MKDEKEKKQESEDVYKVDQKVADTIKSIIEERKDTFRSPDHLNTMGGVTLRFSLMMGELHGLAKKYGFSTIYPKDFLNHFGIMTVRFSARSDAEAKEYFASLGCVMNDN